jgi:hypothetical protein
VRPEFTRRTVLGLIAGSAAATVTGVSAGTARAAVPASPGVTYTNTIAEQRADPHITVEGIWAHVKRSLANLAVVDAVDQRDEVALAHVPPQLVPLVGRFQARPSARTARLPACVPFPGAAAPQRVALNRLEALVRNRLKHLQYRPDTLDGFIAGTGLALDDPESP